MDKLMMQIAKPDDRQAVAAILFKNGYQVRLVTQKVNGRAVSFVEATKGGTSHEQDDDHR